MFGLGTWEVLLLVGLGLLLFNRQLPALGASLAGGIVALREGLGLLMAQLFRPPS